MKRIRVTSGVPGELSYYIEVPEPHDSGLVTQLAGQWKLSKQRIRYLLSTGRIEGVRKDPETGCWEKIPGHLVARVRPGKRGPNTRAFSVHF